MAEKQTRTTHAGDTAPDNQPLWTFMWPARLLILPPYSDPVLESMGWHERRQYYRNGTLNVNRQTVTADILRRTVRPSCHNTTFKPGLGLAPKYTGWASLYSSDSRQTKHFTKKAAAALRCRTCCRKMILRFMSIAKS